MPHCLFGMGGRCWWPRTVLKDNGIKCNCVITAPSSSPHIKDHLIWLSGSLPVVCNFFCISFYHGDLTPHFCYILLKIRDNDKRMELLETSLFLAPAYRLYEKDEEDHTPFFIHPSCPVGSDLNTVSFMKSLALSDALHFTMWLTPQDDTTLFKVLKCAFLAKSCHFFISLHSLSATFDCTDTAF